MPRMYMESLTTVAYLYEREATTARKFKLGEKRKLLKVKFRFISLLQDELMEERHEACIFSLVFIFRVFERGKTYSICELRLGHQGCFEKG